MFAAEARYVALEGATLSTTEAEYVALGEGVNEVLFSGAVLSFLL